MPNKKKAAIKKVIKYLKKRRKSKKRKGKKRVKPTDTTNHKVKKILESLEKGSSIVAACAAVGMDRTTFWRWKNASDKNSEKFYEIIDSRSSVVEDALYLNATKGKKVIAQIFWLKNRAPERWMEETTENLKVQDVEVIPPNIKPNYDK